MKTHALPRKNAKNTKGWKPCAFTACRFLCALCALLWLTSCAGYTPQAKICYVRDGNTVCVSATEKDVLIHGEHADGKNVISADFAIPRNKGGAQ